MQQKGRQTVLVVEDDAELRDSVLLPGLAAFGFRVTGVGTAAAMYRELASGSFGLIVLDVMLPDEDGFAVAAHLRSVSDVGIVMLSGLDSAADRVRGFREGADIYLTKPVDIEVLAASLHSLARRLETQTFAVTRSATTSWRMEADGWRMVAPDGSVIALSLAERLILNRLSASREEPVSRENLVATLEAHIDDFDAGRLEMLVHRLRRKVASKSGHDLPLTAVRKVGYLLTW